MSASARWNGRPGARALLSIAFLGLALALGPPPARGAEPEEPGAAEPGPHDPLTLVDGRLRAGTAEDADEIDDVSAYCLACHGDEVGAGPRAHPTDSAARDHPVDLAYPAGRDGYRAAAELDPALLLLEGRVTCVTCHAHDDPRHATVLPTEQSQICTACHLL